MLADKNKYVLTGNAIRSLYQMIILIDRKSYECQVIDYNKEFKNITEVVTDFDDFFELLFINIHPEDREAFEKFTNPECFPTELSDKVFVSMECRIRQADNKYCWSEITFCHATEEDKAEGDNYLFLVMDIHEWKMKELQKEAQELMVFKKLQDKYDSLFEENMKDAQTGCYNRKGLKYYSDMVIDEAKKNGLYLFVCVADLNGLKHLNDTYGHMAGDEAIAAVSHELITAAPAGSRIVRTGGDEFLMFAAIDKDSKEPYEMQQKIDSGLEAYNSAHSNPYTIGASYGWVLLPAKEDMTDLDEYVEIADAKMYEMRVQRDKYRRS